MTRRRSFFHAGQDIAHRAYVAMALCGLFAFMGAAQAQIKPDAAPSIIRAGVNETTGQLVIQGSHLAPASGAPTVTLDGGVLSLVSYSSGQIVANFPSGLNGIGGTFVLKVTVGTASGTIDLAVGATELNLPYVATLSSQASAGISITNPNENGDGIDGIAVGGNGVMGQATNGGIGVMGLSTGTLTGGFGMYAVGGGASATGYDGGEGVEAIGGPGNNYGGDGVYGTGGVGCGGHLAGCLSGRGGVFVGGGNDADGLPGGDGVDAFIGSSGGVGIYAAASATVGTHTAGYFAGNVQVTGSLSKAGGSFKIDHPLDPAHKYLYHSFVESPDMMNVYNGNTTTDAHGHAMIILPTWFETLNRDYRYQLTAIGQPAQVWVASKILNNSFTINSDKPNVEVSWQVTGIRQDAWANAHRIPVEEEKPAGEQDHYLHPELFGHPDEPSIPEVQHPRPKPPLKRQY